MLLLIEIALTVSAWRKGWGGKALRPFGYAFAIAFLIAVVTAASGGTVNQVAPILLLVDVGLIIALVRMVLHGPEPARANWRPAPVAEPEAEFKVLQADAK